MQSCRMILAWCLRVCVGACVCVSVGVGRGERPVKFPWVVMQSADFTV